MSRDPSIVPPVRVCTRYTHHPRVTSWGFASKGHTDESRSVVSSERVEPTLPRARRRRRQRREDATREVETYEDV